MIGILHYLRILSYGNYDIFLISGNAGFISSAVGFLQVLLGASEASCEEVGVSYGCFIRFQGLGC